MYKHLSHFLHFLIIIALFGCGGSKDEIVLENESPESLLQKGEVSYENGNYEEALKLANMMMDNFPTSDLHIDGQLLICKTLGAQEKYEDQFDLLLRVLKENIIPEKVPIIYSQIGAFYEHSAKWNPGTVTVDSVDFSKAADFYKKAVFYPNSKDHATKSMALYRMALLHAKLKNIEIATKAYQELIETYPESPYSTLARTKLADPTNTDELPLPTAVTPDATATQVESEPVIMPPADQPVTTEETLPIMQEQPEQIQLPDDESEEPSFLDSLQTIDDDSPESSDE